MTEWFVSMCLLVLIKCEKTITAFRDVSFGKVWQRYISILALFKNLFTLLHVLQLCYGFIRKKRKGKDPIVLMSNELKWKCE